MSTGSRRDERSSGPFKVRRREATFNHGLTKIGSTGGMSLPVELSPDRWIGQIFAAKAVGQGGVIRRKSVDIDRLIGGDRFMSEVEKRGFRAIENNGQILVLCNRAPVRILV